MNFKKEFNKRVRENIWNKHNQRFIMFFNYALVRLERIDNYYIPNNLLPPNALEQRIYRLELGYHGIGKPGGIPSKIMSKDSYCNERMNTSFIIHSFIHFILSFPTIIYWNSER